MKKVIVVTILAWLLSGCAAILGVKSYQSGDTKIDFITGYDFGLGANGVDTVVNNRGIKPGEGYNSKDSKESKHDKAN